MPDTSYLNSEQAARLEALQASSSLSRRGTGFASSTIPDVPELVDLAEYIIRGAHPLERYDGTAEEILIAGTGDVVDS